MTTPSDLHRLTDLDPVKRVAVCSVCGPTRVKAKGLRFRCYTRHVEQRRRRDRRNRTRKVKPHRAYVEDVCGRCGFVPQSLVQLDVHHKDGNHSNNDPSNLETLCANCHRLEH